ncbi:forkhead box protein N3-like [Diadema setosum]|uniref:forkhead box protein N3-like n=1 Tax=Diadema setosum TaxID=31175 RepID=UPI003B3A2DB2
MPPNRKPEDSLLKKPHTLGLSQSFPASSLSTALKQVKIEMEDTDLDLNSSCFGAIRMDKGPLEDDELKPLGWLHTTNVLKDINLDDDEDDDESYSKENDVGSNAINGYYGYQDDTMDPHRHINSKPPFSFSCLIFMSIEDCPLKRLPVKEIYRWIQDHFPYFRTAPTGWKNSVRHNLSLNKCFRKVDKIKGQSLGKGSLWCVDPDYRPNLLQALKKTPYHPYHHVLPYSPYGFSGGPLSNISSNSNRLSTVLSAYNGVPIPAHIALVERLLNGQPALIPTHHNGPDLESEVDAAATMMMFRTPPDRRLAEHDRLKRESYPGVVPATNMNGYQVISGVVAPMQIRPEQPHCRPTLSDLAETALNEMGGQRMAVTPENRELLKAKCTPSPEGSDDHTYSLSSSIKIIADHGYSSDPGDVEMSDFSDESFEEEESDMERDAESRRLGDSGIHTHLDGDKKVDEKEAALPLKKRPPRVTEEAAIGLLTLSGFGPEDMAAKQAASPGPVSMAIEEEDEEQAAR